MTDLRHRLTELDQLDAPDMRASIDQRVGELRSAGPEVLVHTSGTGWRGPFVAIGTAVAILVVVAGSLLLLGGDQTDVVEEPTTTVAVETPMTVPDVTTTTPPPVPPEPRIIPAVPSQTPPADQGPLEWRWDPNAHGGFDATGRWRWDPAAGGYFDTTALQEPGNGYNCYGNSGDRSKVVEFGGSSINFQLGYVRTPEIVVTDTEGTAANVGNPFGEQAWLCSVAATDTHLLAVGSSVWWSTDGIAWNHIEEFEVFEEVAVRNLDGSNLMWAAAGPGGYIVLGRASFSEQALWGERVGWYSEDLDTWHEIPVEDGRLLEGWDLFGPEGIAVGNEPVILMGDGGWIATRQ